MARVRLRVVPADVLVADRRSPATADAIHNLQERGEIVISSSGTPVYEGMIVGENARPDDIDVNVPKAKKLNDMRSSTAEAGIRLIPPRIINLDQALETINEDELVEVTPDRTSACAIASSTSVPAGRRPLGLRPGRLRDTDQNRFRCSSSQRRSLSLRNDVQVTRTMSSTIGFAYGWDTRNLA